MFEQKKMENLFHSADDCNCGCYSNLYAMFIYIIFFYAFAILFFVKNKRKFIENDFFSNIKILIYAHGITFVLPVLPIFVDFCCFTQLFKLRYYDITYI